MKKTHIAVLISLAALFAIIVGAVSNLSSMSTFELAKENPEVKYRIKGVLAEGKDIEYNPEVDANLFSFYMIDDDGNESKVICNGDKPRDFELSDEIVVIGKMKNDIFYASDYLTKCPSKYTEDELAASK